MDHLLLDSRLALRRLRQSPGFTAAAILTLALGIGANTTTFSALNKLLVRPLPVERPGELVFLNTQGGNSLSYPTYKDFRDRTRTLSGLITYRPAPVSLSLNGTNAFVFGYEVSGNYFEVLGVKALLGRALTPGDDQKRLGHPVVVLSYAKWKSRFGGDPDVVGKTVKLNGLAYTILGVMPPEFFGTERLLAPEFWVPMAMEPQIEPGNDWLEKRGTWNCWVVGRLSSGVTAARADAELNTIGAQLARDNALPEGTRIFLSPPGLLGNQLRNGVIGFATVLMGVSGLVLLIACTNLANLLLARASDRRKEIAVRLALGASRWRLIRQLLAESLLLSIAGAAGGLLLASWIVGFIASWRPPLDIPINFDVPLDHRVLLFTAAAGLLTTLLFGLAPAIQSARTDLVSALKNAAGRFRRWQPRELLVTAQISLSVLLLVATSLVVHSLQRALTINIGFNPQNAAAVGVDLGLAGYDHTRGAEFQRRLVLKAAALPGIQSAALADTIPLSIDQSHTSIRRADKPEPKPSDTTYANYYEVGPGYFRTMRTRILSGRAFDAHDREGAPSVAIINRALAQRLFPNENAVGGRLAGWGAGPTEIVGVAEDGKYDSLSDSATPAVFWPILQHYGSTTLIIARSSLPAEQVVRMLQNAIHELDPTLPFYQAGSLDDHLRLPLLPARLAASMLGAFGALAVVLAATGVYGVMTYAVARRRREIGIRIAIGATGGQVMSLVMRRTVMLLAVGSTLGALAALAAGGLLSPILYNLSPKDPAAFSLALVLMAAVALAAAWLPALNAARIEPASALREE
jgi:predicted permease